MDDPPVTFFSSPKQSIRTLSTFSVTRSTVRRQMIVRGRQTEWWGGCCGSIEELLDTILLDDQCVFL